MLHSGRPGTMRTDDALEALAARGAETLATRCLAVQRGEHVRLFHHGTTVEHRLVADALRAAGAIVRDIDLTAMAASVDERAVEPELRAALEGAAASVAIGRPLAPRISFAMVRVVQEVGVRHIHIPRADLRVMASSFRAEPDTIERINARLVALLSQARKLEVTSDAGTDLEISVGLSYPLVADCGRPAPGGWDNLPTGFVYFHPASMRGTFVVDRLVLGEKIERSGERLRAAGLRVGFSAGRVTEIGCADEALLADIEAYFASAPNAARAGFVSVPTNYLALNELGHPAHDGLLPGIRIQLGFSDSKNTRAPFDMDAGLRFAGKKLTLTVGGETIVERGRLTDTLVGGIDPLRGDGR